MYLKSFKITNFRKFRTSNNTIGFVKPEKKDMTYSPSSATTLIVGKNNSGKTSITAALLHAVKHQDPKGNIFNFDHLQEILQDHKAAYHKNESPCSKTPYMSFEFLIDFSDENQSNSLQNIAEFVDIERIKEGSIKEVTIELKYSVRETAIFSQDILTLLEKNILDDNVLFREFVKTITNKTKFKQTFLCNGEEVVPSRDFKLSDLIDVKIVSANLDNSQNSLSNVFNKIIKYKLRYNQEDANVERESLDNNITKINTDITTDISIPHEAIVNSVVNEIIDGQHMQVSLRSDLDFDSLFSNLICYEFKEGRHFIPENQFGLGYSNLMKILGHIIDYVEKYEELDSKSKINIICIEEPENFMHPQMQELFINHIDKAVETILGKRKKSINSQLLITTHSSHILNSKIHASNTFNNINYLTSDDSNMTISVQLNDENIQGVDNNKHDLNFLKKHIKFKVSDLFFSDAIIIVEGITEEQLITSYLTERNKLKKKYISVFNINGAFAHIYIPLIELLKVPCLIVTDLDIKRTSIEKSEYQQVSTIEQRETTNSVIEKYWNNINFLPIKNNTDNVNKKRKKFSSNISYVNMMNLHIVFQKDSIEKYYATSFEEAFILTNYNNDLLNNTLKKIIPKSYKEIITSTENTKNLIINSFKLQRKLSNSKSYFSNTLIHKMANEPYENWPLIPKYIDDGLIWLEEQLSAKLSSEA